jgi:general secretion pathway protein D
VVVKRYFFLHFIFVILLFLSIIIPVFAEGTGNQLINMNFKGADIKDVLRTIAELSSVNLITDDSVKGNITVCLKDITFINALDLITRTHHLAYKWNDNTIVVATPDRIIEIYENMITRTLEINHAGLQDLKEILLAIYPDLNVQLDKYNHNLIIKGLEERINDAVLLIKKIDLPREMITEIVKINHVNLEEIGSTLQNFNPDLKIVQEKINNYLFITGAKEEVNNTMDLIKQIDTAPEEDVVRIIEIERGDPASIREYILGIYANITIQLDGINNQLILSGAEKDMDKAIDLIKRLDIAPEKEVVEIVKIRNIEAGDIKEKVQGIYSDLKVQVDETNSQLIIAGKTGEIQAALKLIKRLDLIPENRLNDSVETEIKDTVTVTELVPVNYLELEKTHSIVSELYPDVKLQLNEINRELIISGKQDLLEEVIAFIKRIDLPRRQVIIEARVEEISGTELKSLGIYPERLSQINFIKSNEGDITGIDISWPETIQALEDSGYANTLANPRLMTLNGERARLLIGDRIPVIVEDVQEDHVTRSIQYIDAGITLEFTPWITTDNQINLEINPKVSSIGESVGSSLPSINTREVETKIRLEDGETFAIGGLIQDDIIESVSRVPLLSEIPILGELFKRQKVDQIKTEVIIFITPHIVRESIDKSEETEIVIDTEEEEAIKEEEIVVEKKEQKVEIIGLTKEEIEQILKEERRKREYEEISNLLPETYYIYYTVKDKENMIDIAELYGVSVDDILSVNSIDSVEVVEGTVIIIPIPQRQLYLIKKGDNLWRLYKKTGVSVERIMELNNISDECDIPIGMIIVLPIDFYNSPY